MAKTRDDFAEPVKRRLMLRAGTRCSNPSCRKATTGPSDTNVSQVSIIGAAAHITAAAPNGPRWDGTLTSAERASYDNGIWACANHATLIDTDENRYSVDLLRQWKARAELLARIDLETDTDSETLFAHRVTSHTDHFREAVGNFTDDIGLRTLVGQTKRQLIVRLLREIALNAIEHAKVLSFELSSTAHSISVSFQGPSFSWEDLRAANPRGGGALSLEDLEELSAGDLAYVHQFSGAINTWTIVNVVRDLTAAADAPCTATIRDIREDDPPLQVRFGDCQEIHVLLGSSNAMASDIRWFALSSQSEFLRSRRVFFYGLDENDPLRRHIATLFPSAKVI
jgi:hypothetical protein